MDGHVTYLLGVTEISLSELLTECSFVLWTAAEPQLLA